MLCCGTHLNLHKYCRPELLVREVCYLLTQNYFHLIYKVKFALWISLSISLSEFLLQTHFSFQPHQEFLFCFSFLHYLDFWFLVLPFKKIENCQQISRFFRVTTLFQGSAFSKDAQWCFTDFHIHHSFWWSLAMKLFFFLFLLLTLGILLDFSRRTYPKWSELSFCSSRSPLIHHALFLNV